MKNLAYIQNYPWLSWLIYTLITGVFYFSASHWPPYEPLIIHPSAIDAWIPLWSPAAYIYVTYFLLLPALIVIGRSRPGFSIVYGTALLCGILNAILFLLIPTALSSIPRAPDASLLQWIQTTDTPNSVFPSGHVSLPFCIGIMAFQVSKSRRAISATGFWHNVSLLYIVWAILISASTVLTGQHFTVDVLGGLLFAMLVTFFAVQLYEQPGLSLAAPTLAALALEWTFIAVILYLTIRFWSWYSVVGGMILLSTRQHALLVLYHDAVHFLITSNKRFNDFIINFAAGVPFHLPVHMYRSLHLSHHRDLGTERDPEKVLLYYDQPWNYSPLRTGTLVRQLLGDLLMANSLRMVLRYFRELRNGGSLKLEKTRFYSELPVMFLLFWGVAATFYYFHPGPTLKLLVIWFGTYFTFTQVLQKIRSFAEHTAPEDDPELACSWSSGWLGRLFIWPYNINYHREHHKFAGIPWYRLPEVFAGAEQRSGLDLVNHLWRGTGHES